MTVRAPKGTLRVGRSAMRVAAVSALGLLLLLVVVTLSGQRNTYELKAVFDDVRGLIPGGDVTAGAIVVGSVSSVELNEDGNPEVTMQIDRDFQVHQGTFANIRLASNVGAVNRVVDLTEGDSSLPELEEGATLSGADVDNPVDFDLAVSTLKPKVRADFKQVLIGLDEALKSRGPDFDRTLRHSALALGETSRLLGEVNRDGEALRTIVAEGRRVFSALAERPDQLGESAERLATLLGTTGARQAELSEATEHIGPALEEGRKLLDRTSAAVPTLRELVGGAGPLVDELGPFAKLVPPATRAAGPFLRETRLLVEGAPGQLRQQEGLLEIAPPLLAYLEPLLDRLQPVGDYLRIWGPETIGFFQNVADASAGYDLNGHMIRTASAFANSMPPSTVLGGPVGPSECAAGLLEEPFHRTPGVLECQPWEDWESSLQGGGD